jgi:hypothetical protein
MAMVESGCLSADYMSANKAKTILTDQATHKDPDAVTLVATAKRTQTRPFEKIANVVIPNDHLNPNVLAISSLGD